MNHLVNNKYAKSLLVKAKATKDLIRKHDCKGKMIWAYQ